MIELKLEPGLLSESEDLFIPVSFHSSFAALYKKLSRFVRRFPLPFDDSITNDLLLFYSLAKKRFLDHRNVDHLLGLVLANYFIQKKLLSSSTLSSQTRHLLIRWMPTNLSFPFASKPVLGCLIGFNMLDRCELFDEENVLVALQKHFPELQLVKESYYRHNSQYEHLKIFYFEVEKKNGTSFSLLERKLLKVNLEEKIKNSIQRLVPSVFMKLNQEEIYKNVLILSQEITSIRDLPQVHISLDQYNGKEVAFQINIVQVSPFKGFSFKERFFGYTYLLERMIPVRYLEGFPVEAYLFRLFLPCDPSLLRSDGSLNSYVARQKVASILTNAIGEFRDYNGGLLIKQHELLYSFKQNLPEHALQDEEFMESFFHCLVPLEKQALLDPQILASLFLLFLDHRNEKPIDMLSYKTRRSEGKIFISVRSNDPSVGEMSANMLSSHLFESKNWAYNVLDLSEGNFFNCVLLEDTEEEVELFLEELQEALHKWTLHKSNQQTLRIALGHSMFSLDPRVGGESLSSDVLRLLFEGLTRFDKMGNIENGVAESIEISSDLKVYTFKLRTCFWNEGSLITAHDFAYAWKKILSPDFATNFALLFYPIKNAREAKKGEVCTDQVGIYVIDDRTLQIELSHPTPYFLQLTAHPLFSPVHRLIDQQRPQWPHQSEENYPCNGPFQLKMNQQNRGYQLIKNPLYWDASQINLNQITFTPMDPFSASQAFLKDEIDWIGSPFSGKHIQKAPNERVRILSSSNNGVSWFVFNTQSPLFKNVKVRQAFAFAIDRSLLIKEVDTPLVPAYSVLEPICGESREKLYPLPDDKKARALLEEGLAEMGLSRKDVSIELTYLSKGLHVSVAAFIARICEEKLEIDCRLEPFSWDAFFERMNGGKFQIGLMHWTTLIDDPIYTLNAFRFSGEGTNFANWESREFQTLLEHSDMESNPFQRSLALTKAEQLLSQEMPVIPLYYHPSQTVIRSNFHINVQHASRGSFNFSRSFYKKGVKNDSFITDRN